MYIIDDEKNKKIDCVTILLNKEELKQMVSYGRQLLEAPEKSDHYHLSSVDYQKEMYAFTGVGVGRAKI